jgi:hypothetical protein
MFYEVSLQWKHAKARTVISCILHSIGHSDQFCLKNICVSSDHLQLITFIIINIYMYIYNAYLPSFLYILVYVYYLVSQYL